MIMQKTLQEIQKAKLPKDFLTKSIFSMQFPTLNKKEVLTYRNLADEAIHFMYDLARDFEKRTGEPFFECNEYEGLYRTERLIFCGVSVSMYLMLSAYETNLLLASIILHRIGYRDDGERIENINYGKRSVEKIDLYIQHLFNHHTAHPVTFFEKNKDIQIIKMMIAHHTNELVFFEQLKAFGYQLTENEYVMVERLFSLLMDCCSLEDVVVTKEDERIHYDAKTFNYAETQLLIPFSSVLQGADRASQNL